MKHLYFSIILIFLFIKLPAQNITAIEVLSLSTKSISQINSFLINKNWQFNKNEKPDSAGIVFSTWGYFKQSDLPDSEHASTWIALQSIKNRLIAVNYQFYDKNIYNSILSLFKKAKLKKDRTYFNDDSVNTIYLGHSISYELTIVSKDKLACPFSLLIYGGGTNK